MIKNNNPGNIRLIQRADGSFGSAFAGEIRPGDIAPNETAGFRKFDTLGNGYRAMMSLLYNSYLKNGFNTIAKIIPRYAPSSDNNNPSAYIDYVSNNTGIDRDTVLNGYADLVPVVKAMTHIETGQDADNNSIMYALNSLYNPLLVITEIPRGAENILTDIPFIKKYKVPLFIGTLAIAYYFYEKKEIRL
jgi:hypothetical protein